MNRPTLEDKVRGTLFGHAVGDALGLGTEFLSKAQVAEYYPSGLESYGQIVGDAHRSRWERGDWTDDTDQMLCILDSLLSRHEVDKTNIAARIHQWAMSGGMGIGRTVRSVITSPEFLDDPEAASRRVWESSGREGAANGAVMRTSVLGVWDYDRPEEVRKNAELACKVTHFDPRCVASCVCVCSAISALLRGADDIVSLLADLENETVSCDERAVEVFAQAREETLDALNLDEGSDPGERNAIGYTFKALGAGLWALQHASSYREGVLAVICEGGDADSNACVAGALLGARFGFSDLPPEWVDGLLHRDELDCRVTGLLALM